MRKTSNVELDDADLRDRVANLQRGFTPPPELTGSRPRDVELTAGGRAVYVVSTLLFALALVVTLLLNRKLAQDRADQRAFEMYGAPVMAEVTRLWRGSDDSKTPWLAYRYAVGGRDYQGRAKIRLTDWRALHEGSALSVDYLSSDPGRSHPSGADLSSMPAWLPMLAGLAMTIPPILLIVLLNAQRRLMAEGRPAPALVTRLVKIHSSHGGRHRSMRYAFPLLSGSMATGRSDTNRKGTAEGSVICIVYDPDRPRRSQPYPFALVRPAKLAR